MSKLSKSLFLAAVALQPLIWSQPTMRGVPLASLTQPRVPGDPLELVTGEAESVQTVEQRAAAVNLVKRALASSLIREHPPYHLQTTLTVSGPASPETWTMEDMAPERGLYRWTVQGPSLSMVNVYTGGILYSTEPSGGLPLRLVQIREAVLYHREPIGAHTALRTAPGWLNGAELACVLLSQRAEAKPPDIGRRWEEAEYCVDPRTNLLMTWSPAPGVYVAYDYSTSLHLNGVTVAGAFRITQAGHTVVEGRTVNLPGAESLDPALFDPTGLNQVGVGSIMQVTSRLSQFLPNTGPRSALHVVIVHGVLEPNQRLSEAEVVASTSEVLNRTALDSAARVKRRSTEQSGATPQTREVFVTVQIAVPAE